MLEIVKSLFVSEAWAMAPPPGGEGGAGGAIAGLMPLVIIFAIFYFLLIRPQQKKQKETEQMQSGLQKGDKVVTTGGIYGLVEQVGERTVTIKIAENTKVKFGRSYISQVRSSAEED
jgi:preprotein translocase subunit YajC